ncbi:hypothetical protein [Ruminiclostridium cellobioparum]|uniref:hypothetical protein n=1 Tax=Ruminiclostridium cellobioparum TaxID=29355 RepID=UPI0028B151F6|nr:hypothetical protein [Ruminiclostridium cellobioparum]
MEEKNRKLRNVAKTLIERIELYEKIDGKKDPNYKNSLSMCIEEAIDYIAKREFEK